MKHTFNAPVHMVDFAPKPYKQRGGSDNLKAIVGAVLAAPVIYAIIYIVLSL